MKKREISPIELKKVVELRQFGAKWTDIAKETKVERRAAKRAYEEWEKDKKIREQEAARFRVAAEAFHEHINDLVRLAGSLITNLEVRTSLEDMKKNSKEFFPWLFEQDLLLRYMSPRTQLDVYTMGDTQSFHIGESPQVYHREKELLFESLKVHTLEKIPWEDILDNRWKDARDNCARIVLELQKETSDVVNNFLTQEPKTDFLRNIKERSREDDPVKRMTEAVLGQTWRVTLQDTLDEEGPWFETVLGHIGAPQDRDVFVKSRDGKEKVFTFIGSVNKSLADEVTRLCNLVSDNLRIRGTMRELYREVGNMKKASEELNEMLNPVKLRPLILRTRCDLCPA